jgi:hypothetical protein
MPLSYLLHIVYCFFTSQYFTLLPFYTVRVPLCPCRTPERHGAFAPKLKSWTFATTFCT